MEPIGAGLLRAAVVVVLRVFEARTGVSGPVFVKFGQWASTRPDIFSESFVASIQSLQDSVNPHPYSYTLNLCKRTFGELGMHRLVVDEKLIGSGSMAQVHHGRVLDSDGRWTEVAVKVLHPNTPSRIETDLFLMSVGAKLIHAIPATSSCRCPNPFEQFSQLLQQHNDMVHEASNMDLFRLNFKGWDNIHFSAVCGTMSCDKILVEELETGVPLRAYLRHGTAGRAYHCDLPGPSHHPCCEQYELVVAFLQHDQPAQHQPGPEHRRAEPPGRAVCQCGRPSDGTQPVPGATGHAHVPQDDDRQTTSSRRPAPGNLLVNVKSEYKRLHPPATRPLTLDYLLTLPASAISLTVLDTALVTTLRPKEQRELPVTLRCYRGGRRPVGCPTDG